MTLNEKAAYIKGLADGLEIDAKTKEGKIIAALLDLVTDMAQSVSDLEEDVEYLNDYIEEIDEDLGDVEECLCEDDCDCGCCDCEDDELYEVECPSCGEEIYLDDEMLDEEFIECPACGEKFTCEFVDEDEEEDEE